MIPDRRNNVCIVQSRISSSIQSRLWLAKYQLSDPKTSDGFGGLRRRRVVDVWDFQQAGRAEGREMSVSTLPVPRFPADSIFVRTEQ